MCVSTSVVFVLSTYRPSDSEHAWQGDVTHRICEIARSQRQSMLQYLSGDLSQMSYLNGRPIEPLTGIGRHPLARVGCGLHDADIFNTSHLRTQDRCGKESTVARLFDMGCADFKAGTTSASASGSSIPFFMHLYRSSCVEFDEIYGWEARTIPNWWRNVPSELRGKIRFHNEPVSAAKFAAALSNSSRDDFVVVKLDIDNTEVEMTIIDVILKHHHLVDELFFEYHYYFDGLNFGWGKLEHLKHTHNATSAMQLMTRLRRLGIRAHFWV